MEPTSAELAAAGLDPLVTEDQLRAVERTRDQEWISYLRCLDVRDRLVRAGLWEEIQQEASALVTGAVDWCLQTTQQGS